MPVQNGYNAYSPQPISGIAGVPRVNNINAAGNWNMGYSNNYVANDGKIHVNGRAGADAFPLPMGMNVVVLWDTDSPRFFVKGYDDNGIPRVLEDNDYAPHIEPEVPQQVGVDMSAYATKEDIQAMIAEAFSNMPAPNMSGYVTKKVLDKALSELTVGSGGKVVRANDAK